MNLRYRSKTLPYQLGTSDSQVKEPSQGPACRRAAPPAPLPCGEQESARGTPRKTLSNKSQWKLKCHPADGRIGCLRT